MFCDRCGAAVPNQQSVCPQCAKQFPVAMSPVYIMRSRIQQHLRLLGILWLALSAFNAVGGLAVFLVANTIFAQRHFNGPSGPGPAFLHPLLLGVGAFVLVKAAVGFIAGWGLLRREPWARMLTIVLSFFALFNVPFGTLLGIYGLWILLPAESEREYEQESLRVAA